MKELIKPKKKKVVFEKLNFSTYGETPDGYYHRENLYSDSGGDDLYLRGGDPGFEDEILF
jgi:hypothetical protein